MRARHVLFSALVGASLLAACGADQGADPAAAPDDAARPAPEAAAPRLGPKVFPMAAAPLLDDPARDAWQHPDEVVAALRLEPGDRVADIGCGTGYFTLRLADAVGPEGHVIAVDLQQGMLDLLAKRLPAEERERVTLRCNEPTRPLEPGDAVRVVFCANTLYEVPHGDAVAFVRSMADGLAPGGRLVVLEWLRKPMDIGPAQEHRISRDRVRELATAAGLTQTGDVDLLPTHSFQVFTKAP